MSLKPEAFTIPEETARVAKAAFPKGNPYLKLRDELGVIFEDEAFESYFAERGQPAYSPARLALVLILQYAEGLSDRQAAEAVRARLDFKYVLGLELTDPGFDASVLSEFRTRLIEGEPGKQLLDKMLTLLMEKGLVKSKGKQRSDSTHSVASVHALNRLESVGETMRYALNQLAVVAPEWLRPHLSPTWVERYVKRLDNYRLPKSEGQARGTCYHHRRGRFLLTATDLSAECTKFFSYVACDRNFKTSLVAAVLPGDAER
jgi:transposase